MAGGDTTKSSGMTTYLRHLLKTLVLILALCLVAAWPVVALSGSRGLVAFLLGAAACWVGAALGRLPHLFFRGPDAIFHASMAGVGARLLGTMTVASPLLLISDLPRMPLAAGLVLAYLMLLVLEVWELMALSRTLTSTPAGDAPSDVAPTAVSSPGTPPPAKGVPAR